MKNSFTLVSYINKINFPLKKLTVCYPIKKNKILLGKKIKVGGLGEGYYLGFGGKLEAYETFEDGAKREIFEEVGIKTQRLIDMGKVYFYFPHKQDKEKWNMETQIFIVAAWKGKPISSDEMQPKWYLKSKIPYQKMWDDNKLWLPYVLKGKRIEAHILYSADNKTVSEFAIKFI